MADPITQEAPLKTYTGSCHCGAVEFEVTHPDLEIVGVSNCNCSICRRNGYLMIYPPPKDINFIRGNDFMTGYEFNTKAVSHRFCPTCGTSIIGDKPGRTFVAVNIRTLHGIEPDKIKQYRYLNQKGGHRSDGPGDS